MFEVLETLWVTSLSALQALCCLARAFSFLQAATTPHPNVCWNPSFCARAAAAAVLLRFTSGCILACEFSSVAFDTRGNSRPPARIFRKP